MLNKVTYRSVLLLLPTLLALVLVTACTREVQVVQTVEVERVVEKEVQVVQTVEVERVVEKEVEVIRTVEVEKQVDREV